MNEKEKNNGATTSPENAPVHKEWVEPTTTEEKAQYQVFARGDLPKDQLREWINNDLRAVMSCISTLLTDKEDNSSLVDAFYARYQKLHPKTEEK